MPEASAVDARRWSLRLCGLARMLSPDDETVMLERRDAAMLALLALDGPTPRARIGALLWPDEALEAVRGRLRQRIYALKRKLGAEAVAGSATLALAPTLAWPGFAGESPDGALLGDDDYADLPSFAEWLRAARQRWQRLRREALAGEASSLEGQGRLAEAIGCAERLLALEPLQEHAHRRLMRLHYLRGDRAAALLAFDRCEQVLKDDVGASPSTETLELLAQIERSQPVAAPAPRRVVPASVLRPPRLIGRASEWSILTDAWNARVPAMLLGDAGLGKTRLLGDLMLAHRDTPLVHAPARPGDAAVPYGLLARLLRALLPLAGEPELHVRSELARVLPEFGEASRDTSEARFQAAIELVLQRATSRGLQAVVLDDLHYADSASLEMVHRVVGADGTRWLFAARPAEASAAALALVTGVEDAWHGHCIRLAPLTQAAVAELVDSIGLPGLDGATLAPQLLQRTGGNPLFLLESLKQALQGAGTPVGTGKVTTLITRRIGQLSQAAVRVARCAAIAAQDCSPALVAELLDVSVVDLADSWAELERADVFRGQAFAHDLVADAARASVPAAIARELHQRIAAWLQARGAPPARVAAHWLEAGDETRAAPCLVDAARAARRALRVRECMDYALQALHVFESRADVEGQLALLGEFSEVAVAAGRSDDVQRECERTLSLAHQDRQRAKACTLLAYLAGSRSDYQAAIRLGERAVALAMDSGDREVELEARCRLAIHQSPVGRADAAVALLAPIEPWVRSQANPVLRLRFHDAHAMAMSAVGRLHDAIGEWQAAAAIARECGDALLLPELTVQIALANFFLGRAQAGRQMAGSVIDDLAKMPGGSVLRRQVLRTVLAMDRDLACYTSALALAEEMANDPSATAYERDNGRLYSASVFVELGQPARARHLLARAEAEGSTSINDVFWTPLRVELAEGSAEAPRVRAEAVRSAQAAAEGRSGRTLYPLRRLLARHAEDHALAIEAAGAALDAAVRSDAQGHVIVFKALLARRLAATGDCRTAVRLAREAWATPPDISPASVYRPQVWLWLHDVLAPHDETLAGRIVRHATDWILRAATEHVPMEFRESFLHRQPVNLALIRLAHGRPGDIPA